MNENRMAEAAGSTIDPLPSTVLPQEIAQFTALARNWWDPEGKFKPLHQLNPSRLTYLRRQLVTHFKLDDGIVKPFAGLRLCDVGCGGGLISEPMSRMGFTVTAIDAGAENIDAAKNHAAAQGLTIDYRATTAEALTDTGQIFDVVLALEIVEHVSDLDLFFGSLARLVAPGGVLIVSTLNRNLRSLALAKIGAEYVLRWLPAGTHDWRKFLKPSEVTRLLRQNGLTPIDLTGLSFDPLRGGWHLTDDCAVNYLTTALK